MKTERISIRKYPGLHNGQVCSNLLGLSGDENNLRKELALIQNAQSSLGISNPAANSLDLPFPPLRKNRAILLGTPPVYWNHFLELEEYLGIERSNMFSSANVVVAMTWAMGAIVSGLSSSDIKNIGYANSNLMRVATDDPPHNAGSYCQGSKQARINAAITLKQIMEKIGDRISDGAEIISKLLDSKTQEVRKQGISIAQQTFKQAWRNKFYNTGLIKALRKEQNADMRGDIAYTIAIANPKAILEEYYIDGVGYFRPITCFEIDHSERVKVNLSWGLLTLLQSSRKEGIYYANFSEIPTINASQKNEILQYALNQLESLLKEEDLSDFGKMLLGYVTGIIDWSVDDAGLRIFNENSITDEKNNFNSLLERLAKIDLLNFVKTVCSVKSSTVNINIWGWSKDVLRRGLLIKSQNSNNPLKCLFDFKQGVQQIRCSVSDSYATSNLESSLSVIDASIQNYLSNTKFRDIKWGNETDFNSSISGLLTLLPDDNHVLQMTILGILHELSINGVSLRDPKNQNLASVLNDSNHLRLQNTLRKLIYSSDDVDKKFLEDPDFKTVSGKALIVYRKLTRSYKDYFGMHKLKEHAIHTAAEIIEEREFREGMLLSGPPGTGKSLFGEVLANELGLQIFSLQRSEIKGGKVCVSEENKVYSVDEYVEKLEAASPCMLLLDEVENILPASSNDKAGTILKILRKIETDNIPVLIVATTNHPVVKSRNEVNVCGTGSSKELDAKLRKILNLDCFEFLKPCYLFHDRIVGTYFAREYFRKLADDLKIEGRLHVNLLSKLCRGLTPASIDSSVTEVMQKTEDEITGKLLLDTIIALKRSSTDIVYLASLIRSKLESLVFEGEKILDGEIDYKDLAIAGEDIPPKEIAKILNNTSRKLSHIGSKELFTKGNKKYL